MSKFSSHKKSIRLVAIIGGIIIIGAGVALWFSSQRQAVVLQKPSAAAQAKVKELNYIGDQTLAARYIDKIQVKQSSAAQELFDTEVAQAATKQDKLALLSQNVLLALEYQQKDAALKVAKQAIAIEPSYATYNNAYLVYVAMDNSPKQQEMLEKAIAVVEASNLENKDAYLSGLRSQLEGVKQQIIAKEAHP